MKNTIPWETRLCDFCLSQLRHHNSVSLHKVPSFQGDFMAKSLSNQSSQWEALCMHTNKGDFCAVLCWLIFRPLSSFWWTACYRLEPAACTEKPGESWFWHHLHNSWRDLSVKFVLFLYFSEGLYIIWIKFTQWPPTENKEIIKPWFNSLLVAYLQNWLKSV